MSKKITGNLVVLVGEGLSDWIKNKIYKKYNKYTIFFFPETSTHPYKISNKMDTLLTLSKIQKVIILTHSAYILEYLSVIRKAIGVLNKKPNDNLKVARAINKFANVGKIPIKDFLPLDKDIKVYDIRIDKTIEDISRLEDDVSWGGLGGFTFDAATAILDLEEIK